MKNRNKSMLLATLVLLLLIGSSITPATAVPTGVSQVSSGCICHAGVASGDVTVTLDGVPSSYAGGDVANLTVTITGGPEVTNESENHGGFNLVASAGTLSAPDNTTQIMDGEATHTAFGNDQRSWQITWTAPSENTQDITFTAHGNSVNGDGQNTDDEWNKAEETLAGVAPPAGDSDPNDSSEETPGFGIALTMLAIVGVAISRVRKNE